MGAAGYERPQGQLIFKFHESTNVIPGQFAAFFLSHRGDDLHHFANIFAHSDEMSMGATEIMNFFEICFQMSAGQIDAKRNDGQT